MSVYFAFAKTNSNNNKKQSNKKKKQGWDMWMGTGMLECEGSDSQVPRT